MPSRDKESKFWLFIEPYVHIACSPGGVLFYNTISKKSLEYNGSPVIGAIGSLLNKPENGYVLPLLKSQVDDDEITRLVNDLRANYMGDILESGWSSAKPSNIFPSPMVKAKLTPKILTKPDRLKEIEFENYLHEVFIYLNSGELDSTPFIKAYKQFFSPFLVENTPHILPADVFNSFVYQADTFKIVTLNLSGIDIFEHPGLNDFIQQLDTYQFHKKYHLSYSINDRYFSNLTQLFKHKSTSVCFYVTFPLELDRLNNLLNFIAMHGLVRKCEFNFIVSDDNELAASREIISQAHLSSYSIKPYYTGRNFSFFSSTVFITREDVRASRPDQFQVFSRLAINEKDFGKLTLFPDGNVFANTNDAALGNIAGESLTNLVLQALVKGKSWKRNRKNVTPCRDCLYHFLCPPISSYEILMRRYNFCDIYQKPQN